MTELVLCILWLIACYCAYRWGQARGKADAQRAIKALDAQCRHWHSAFQGLRRERDETIAQCRRCAWNPLREGDDNGA
ncbi:MAG: hypothetical protein PHZ19_10865 [Candidatus Thermoplasmatota archaeon]|nr:hypothetical protein [Candidatus Thermoplasmatota archaeon]